MKINLWCWTIILSVFSVTSCVKGPTVEEKEARELAKKIELSIQDSTLAVDHFRGTIVSFVYHTTEGATIIGGDVSGAAIGGGLIGYMLMGPYGAIAGSAVAADDEVSKNQPSVQYDDWLLIKAVAESDTVTIEVFDEPAGWIHPDARRFGPYVCRYLRQESLSLRAIAHHLKVGKRIASPVKRGDIRPINNMTSQLIFFDDEPIPYLNYNLEDE